MLLKRMVVKMTSIFYYLVLNFEKKSPKTSRKGIASKGSSLHRGTKVMCMGVWVGLWCAWMSSDQLKLHPSKPVIQLSVPCVLYISFFLYSGIQILRPYYTSVMKAAICIFEAHNFELQMMHIAGFIHTVIFCVLAASLVGLKVNNHLSV